MMCRVSIPESAAHIYRHILSHNAKLNPTYLSPSTTGELFERLLQHGAYTEKVASQLMRQAAKAIYHLHSCGIAHRDIKPENMVLMSQVSSGDGSTRPCTSRALHAPHHPESHPPLPFTPALAPALTPTIHLSQAPPSTPAFYSCT